MQRLDAGDLERVGRFVAEVGEIDGDEPFPPAFLGALRRLVPCDSVVWNELDRIGERHLNFVAEADLDDGLEPAITYWEARADHPLCHYHESTGDWRAYRLCDFVTPRELERRRIYEEWIRPTGQTPLITVGLDAPLSHTKVFLFSRPTGPEFDERDCLVLNVLRPYFAMRYEAARAQGQGVDEQAPSCRVLTGREREILDLVAEGKTNCQIAEQLWISAGTVRRHLENTFAKLGVHTRTAAVRAASLDA